MQHIKRSRCLAAFCASSPLIPSFYAQKSTPFLHSSLNCSIKRRQTTCCAPIMTAQVITFVTGNENKRAEVAQILSADPDASSAIVIVAKKIDLPELQGDPIDIVKEKCRLAVKEIQAPTLVEDTCLCFNAMKGLPGPYIKWFLEKLGLEGLNRMLLDFHDKSAYAMCAFAYSSGKADEEPIVFVGKTPGKIVPARKLADRAAFGWDPIFEPDGYSETYAEMEKSAKNRISHRSKALDQLKAHFSKA